MSIASDLLRVAEAMDKIPIPQSILPTKDGEPRMLKDLLQVASYLIQDACEMAVRDNMKLMRMTEDSEQSEPTKSFGGR